MTSPAIQVRLPDRHPAIAVESAILTSGLPLERRPEAVARIRAAAEASGAEACFVGIVAGTPTVGLRPPELRRLMNRKARKASVRDLAAAIADGADAGTTVAATLYLAHRAGLQVMATGGIGGVHPGPGPTDISADLLELACTPAIVVCSGAKAFLDLASTLEHLETRGVPIVGFGTDECPAFWCRTSGLRLPDRADTPGEILARWRALRRLDYRAALLVCVPPPEGEAFSAAENERLVSRALRELDRAELGGSEVTPFLLRRIAEHTEGRSVEANLALLERNVGVAATIAAVLKEERS